MKYPIILLWTASVLFVIFGIGFIIAPGFISMLITGGMPSTPSAIIDMRATYGGMALGIGLFFGFCARQSDKIHIGLIAALSSLSGIASARLIGILVDGSPTIFIWLLLVSELLFIALIIAALAQLKKG